MKKVADAAVNFVDMPGIDNQDGYSKFLRFALKYADSFCLSVYTNDKMNDLEDFKWSKWGYLSESIIDYEYTTESPVTDGPEVMQLYFKIDHMTKEFLKKKKHIYDFRDCIQEKNYYNWLWDLCFIKEGKIFFVSCTHEEFCCIDKNVLNEYQKEFSIQ